MIVTDICVYLFMREILPLNIKFYVKKKKKKKKKNEKNITFCLISFNLNIKLQ